MNDVLCCFLCQGHLDVVALLINHGAEVACKDKKGYTPLHAAASHGQINVVKHLLNLGVEVSYAECIITWALCVCVRFLCFETKFCMHFCCNERGKYICYLSEFPHTADFRQQECRPSIGNAVTD